MRVRKVNVNFVEYQYVVGRKETQIKGVGNFRNFDIGEKKVFGKTIKVLVTPRTVVETIKKHYE